MQPNANGETRNTQSQTVFPGHNN